MKPMFMSEAYPKWAKSIKKIYHKIQFALVIAIASFIIIGCFFYLYTILRENTLSKRQTEAMSITKQVEFELTHNVENLELTAVNIEHYIEEGYTHQQLYEYMKRESQAINTRIDGNISGIYGWIDGEYIDGIDYVPDADFIAKERPWYTQAKEAEGEVAFITPYVDAQSLRTCVSVAKLLEDHDSVLSMDIFLDDLQSMVSDLKAKNQLYLIVTDDQGRLVACENTNAIGDFIGNYDEFGAFFDEKILTQDKYISEVTYHNVTCYSFSQKIVGDWHVLVLMDTREIWGGLWYVYLLCILALIMVIFSIYGIFRNIKIQSKQVQDYNSRLQAVADIYLCMYEIDLVQDTYEPVKTLPYIEETAKLMQGPCSKVVVAVMKKLCLPDESERIEEFACLQTLGERLKNEVTVVQEFRGLRNWTRIAFVVKNKDRLGNVTNVMLLIQNIDNEIAKRKELMKEAHTDLMTGLFNRRAWEETLAETRQGMDLKQLTIVGMDLNGLKKVNDNLGHFAGDELIIGAAGVIKDYFSQEGEVYRIGGDEFMVFIRNEISSEKEHVFVRELKELVHAWHGKAVEKMSLSIGIASGKYEKLDSIDDLVKLVDQRMYEDKKRYYESISQMR